MIGYDSTCDLKLKKIHSLGQVELDQAVPETRPIRRDETMTDKPEAKLTSWIRISIILVVACFVAGYILVFVLTLKGYEFQFDIHKFHIARAKKYLEKGRVDKAAKLVAKLEKTVPPGYLSDLRSIQLDMGYEYLRTGDIKKAEVMAEKLAKVGYDYEWELGFLGAKILQGKGQYLEAIEAFEKIVGTTFCGNCAAGIRNRKRIGKAECYEQLEKYKDAYLEYLSCIPDFDLSMTVKPVDGLRRVKKKLTESEKKEVDERAFHIVLEFLRDTDIDIMKSMSELDPESAKESFLQDEVRVNTFLYEEGERFGLISALENAEKNIRAAHRFENDEKYKDACLAYVNCINIPWLYNNAEPVESLRDMRKKLKDSEKNEIDAKIAEKLRELFEREHAKNEMISFALPDSETAKYWLGPKETVYPFILAEAERLRIEAPVSSAEMKLRIARYHERTESHWRACLAYIDCIDIPWPYEDAAAIEGIQRLYQKLRGREKEGVDKKTIELLQEILGKRGLRKILEAIAQSDLESVDLSYPENVVYPFILEEAIRLGLIEADQD